MPRGTLAYAAITYSWFYWYGGARGMWRKVEPGIDPTIIPAELVEARYLRGPMLSTKDIKRLWNARIVNDVVGSHIVGG